MLAQALPQRPSVLIVADDLSGAADSAVACAQRGLETVVAFGPSSDAGQADALALDADTRRMTAGEAATETTRLVRSHATNRARVLFKKIDSTLRGHIGVELAAWLDALRSTGPSARRAIAVLAPAFPALKRTTVAGRQHLDGVPLEHTELWRRERMTGNACLPDIVAAAGLASGHVAIETMRRGDDAIRAAIRDLIDRADVVVCDAVTDDELAALARASVAIGGDVLWVGSAGLVGHLIDAAGLTRAPTRFGPAAPAAGPLLFVVGSLSPVSRDQATLLAAQDVVVVTIDGSMLDSAASLDHVADRLAAATATGKDILLMTTSNLAHSPAETAALRDLLSKLIAAQASHIGGLFATGGETARTVLTSMGITALRLVGEVERGVPLSIAVGPRGVPVITKAGAFGSVATMLDCRRALRAWGSPAWHSPPSREACI